MHQTKSPAARRPPPAESPQRLRARRDLCSAASIQTPPSSLAKTQHPARRSWAAEESRARSEMKPMFGEFQVLAKLVEDELGCSGLSADLASSRSLISAPVFERGRFYDEYSARRNERLKRKKGETGEERSASDAAGFSVEFGKRKAAKKTEVRKSVPANFSVPRREGLRSSVRLSKENKQPLNTIFESPAVDGGKTKTTSRTGRRG